MLIVINKHEKHIFSWRPAYKSLAIEHLIMEKAAKCKNIAQIPSVLAQKHPFHLISAILSVTVVKRSYNKIHKL